MTKTEKLKKILETLDWDLDMQALANGPVTATTIANFIDQEWEGYGDDVLTHLTAAGIDFATLTPAQDWERICNLVEQLYWEKAAA
ncbi:hypothetical protein [Williamsia sp.]|uniref:hypothetical protein n=1 Tax=Williamsia sp. TaxID=1872085 RepID=UPI002F9510B7